MEFETWNTLFLHNIHLPNPMMQALNALLPNHNNVYVLTILFDSFLLSLVQVDHKQWKKHFTDLNNNVHIQLWHKIWDQNSVFGNIYCTSPTWWWGKIFSHHSFGLTLFTIVEVDHKQWKTHFTDLKKTMCT